MMDGTPMNVPAWFQAQLTDVRTGDAFTIADLKGKVVLVETMAQWCPKCLEQQKQVSALHQQLGMRDDLVTLALDVDPHEDAATLKDYTERHGFDWLYAVAPAEVSRELATLYGDQFLNPTVTPMLVIDRHGEAHSLPFGIKSAGDLLKVLGPYLAEGM
jgi:thiol-disulfide isomerase/thioredoxin